MLYPKHVTDVIILVKCQIDEDEVPILFKVMWKLKENDYQAVLTYDEN